MNKKYRLLVILSVFGLLVTLSAGTYAYLRKTSTQTGNNVINTLSCLDINLGNITNGVNLINDYPITDNEGLNRTPYTFKVTNNCPTPVRISINLESLALSSNQLSREYVKAAINEVGFNKSIVALDSTTDTEATIEDALSNTLKIDSLNPLSYKDYELRLWIDEDVTKEQGMNKNYEGKIVIHADAIQQNANDKYCYTDDYVPGMTMTAGTEYVYGQYTYHYLEEYTNANGWVSISNGWGVVLTDVVTNNGASTDPVTSPVCTFINGVPVTSASSMYYNSQAISIDLTKFNTGYITNMFTMFRGVVAPLDLSNFDTSNVTDMTRMFAQSQMTTLDLSSFDTSKVTNMSDMFKQSQATSIDLSSFDTSNVTDMSGMFKLSTITNLNAGVFNSTSVTNVNNMFQEANLKGFTTFTMDGTNLTDLNNMFLAANLPSTVTIIITNTGNLTNMKAMFGNVTVTNLTLVIDTSNVTTMESLFSGISATTITISSFNTSKVTNMTTMFDRAPNLKNIYVSNLWNTSKVTKSSDMFNGDTKLKNYNSSYLDKTRAHYNTNGYLTYKANS